MNLFKVHQKLASHPLADVAAETRRQLAALQVRVPAGPVAVTAGSRGIASIAVILREVGAWLRAQGAQPFLAPCMGSHNGATAAGQRAMVESLGMTEAATGMPIRSGMETVCAGHAAAGDVLMDRHCFEAAGVMVVNRLKLHTSFSGPYESGLMKMMVVGMGKIRAAEAFHRVPHTEKSAYLAEQGKQVLATGKIIAGLAIIEDGLDQTAELHALRPDEIPVREPVLLERCRAYFPRLPVDSLEVLVVDEIGKNFSGTGMDTNVIGCRGFKREIETMKPDIRVVAALGLSAAAQGNALGVGLADVITRRLRAAIDERKTLVNVLTTGELGRGKIPLTLDDDETLVRNLQERFGGARWMWIPDTLHLQTLFVTPDLCDELRRHARCRVEAAPVALTFVNGRHQLRFEG